MFVEHPEYSDILVNLDTHRLVYSNDGGNEYSWDEMDNTWCGTETDMGFELFPSESKPRTVISPAKVREDYIKQYCEYNDELHSYVYSYKE